MRKHLLLLAALVVLFFSPVLFNGFAGDDNALFVGNSFYKDLANFPRVFNADYNVSGYEILYTDLKDKGSGSVAYRPVTTLSFFLDSAVWGMAPFGFHATSLLLHIINTLILYAIVAVLFSTGTAFAAALIFGLHPVNAEAVAAIAYRSDLLVAFFVLAGFWAWVSFRRERPWMALGLCAAAYGLALFSKESALLFPLVLWVFTRSWDAGRPARLRWYDGAAFGIIACSYLYVYFLVFPNKALGEAGFPLDGPVAYALAFVQTIAFYLKQVFWPLSAGIVPPLYAFLPAKAFSWGLLAQVLSVVFLALAFWKISRLRPRDTWLSLWAVLFLLPALLPGVNPNPVALRYLYLPFAGAAVLLALGVLALWDRGKAWLSPFLRKAVCACAIVALGGSSFLSALVWKDNFSAGSAWIRSYPDHYMGYGIRGIEFFRKGVYDRAAQDFEAAMKDPRFNNLNFHYLLGFSYLFQQQEDKARAVFEDVMKKTPFFDRAFLGMGFYHYTRGEYSAAVPFFERVFALTPYDENNAANLLIALHKAEGLPGIERGLLMVERAWGKGPQLERLKARAGSLPEKGLADPASF